MWHSLPLAYFPKDAVVSEVVDSQEFRETLALWASGVTIVTARDADGPVGMTVSSFSSLSLDPPLVLACVDLRAKSHDGIVEAPGFVVHVLGRTQEDLSQAFARPGAEKFDQFAWEPGPYDAPLLQLGVARLVCARHATLDGGDHTILVGRVEHVERTDADPLVYWNRSYRSAS